MYTYNCFENKLKHINSNLFLSGVSRDMQHIPDKQQNPLNQQVILLLPLFPILIKQKKWRKEMRLIRLSIDVFPLVHSKPGTGLLFSTNNPNSWIHSIQILYGWFSDGFVLQEASTEWTNWVPFSKTHQLQQVVQRLTQDCKHFLVGKCLEANRWININTFI